MKRQTAGTQIRCDRRENQDAAKAVVVIYVWRQTPDEVCLACLRPRQPGGIWPHGTRLAKLSDQAW